MTNNETTWTENEQRNKLDNKNNEKKIKNNKKNKI